ncbi:MAG: hypothetical protein ACXVJD_04690, partial [Mucilaginibacter sp.]
MRYICLPAIILLMFSTGVSAQQSAPDSMRRKLSVAKADSDKINALLDLGNYYYFAVPDSAIIFG